MAGPEIAVLRIANPMDGTPILYCQKGGVTEAPFARYSIVTAPRGSAIFGRWDLASRMRL